MAESFEETKRRYEETNKQYRAAMNIYAETMVPLILKGVEDGHYPRFLYRFRKSGEVSEILANSSLYFTKPMNLNDPYDSKVKVKIVGSFEEIKAVLKKLNYKNYPESAIDAYANKIVKDPQKAGKEISDFMNNDRSNSRICCFSKTWNNLLMWTHYADSHKGIVLKFDVLADPYFFCNLITMSYRDKVPILGLGEPSSVSYLNSKSNAFEQEQEVRVHKIFDFEDDQYFFEFNKKALVGIIFGAASDDNINRNIMSLSQSFEYTNMEFQKVSLMENEYGLALQSFV